MAFCKYCGSQIDDDSVFCSRCGKRLNGSIQSGQYPPPPEPERRKPATDKIPETETAAQRAHRYQQRTTQNVERPGNTGGPASQKSHMKFVIPAALLAFIVVLSVITIFSNRGGKKAVPTPRPTVPIPTISLPPDIFSPKPTIQLPENTPEPDEAELFDNIAPAVKNVLKAITERPDYILGDFEPLIGVTDVNENGCAEIIAVYETENDGTYEAAYDVWSADPLTQHKVMCGVLFCEVGGNSGVVYLMQDAGGAPYVMLEQNMPTGDYFHTIYDFYKFSDDETMVDFFGAWEIDGRYDTENGGIAEINYYMYESDRVEISAAEFERYFDNYTIVYSLDIVSGEYDWDNTLSFDWAWKLFDGVS